MAITERYVSTTGAGAHDGTSEANAYSWAEMVTAINTPTAAGYRYNVKQGTYSLSATTTITGDGTTTAPCIIRGYKTTPGDATLGRTTYGVLDASNMPTIAYGSTYGLDASGADYIVFEALNFTGSHSGYWFRTGNQNLVVNCAFNNANTGGHIAVLVNTSNTGLVDCDVISAGTAQAVNIGVGTSYAVGCRIKCSGSGGVGLQIDQTASAVNNTIYECGGHGISVPSTGSSVTLIGNTVQGCGGDGIRLANGTTGNPRIVGNHLTDNGGYAINFQTSTCSKMLTHNRTRDNTSGAINGGGDWADGTSIRHVTTDNGTASSDYTASGSQDFSLLSTAVGFQVGPGWKNNIGANGTPAASAGLKGVASA